MNDVKVTFKKIAGLYYINIKDNYQDLILSADVARYLKVDTNEYCQILIKFGAKMCGRGLAFKNESDILPALEWVESIIMMNKLLESCKKNE